MQNWHSNTGMSVSGGSVDYKQDGPRPCTAPLVYASHRVDGVIDTRTQRGADVCVVAVFVVGFGVWRGAHTVFINATHL